MEAILCALQREKKNVQKKRTMSGLPQCLVEVRHLVEVNVELSLVEFTLHANLYANLRAVPRRIYGKNTLMG